MLFLSSAKTRELLFRGTLIWDIFLILFFVLIRILLLILLCFLRLLLPFVLFFLRSLKWTLKAMLWFKRKMGWINPPPPIQEASMDVRYILEKARKKLLEERDKDGYTCLHIAASQSDTKTCIALIDGGGNELLFAKDDNGFNALHVAASHGFSETVVALLNRGGKELWADKSNNGETALHLAAGNGHIDTSDVLIDQGGSELLLSQESDGWTCLHCASWAGYSEQVKRLIARGGEILLMAKANTGGTCLHLAAWNGHTECVRTLIDCGGQELLMMQRNGGWTALHISAFKGHAETCLTLIEHGDRDLLFAQDMDGDSCLHLAAMNWQNDVAQVLVSTGGRDFLNIENQDGETALEKALRHGQHADLKYPPLRRACRAGLRAYLQHEMRPVALAAMMGFHLRLGQASPLLLLDEQMFAALVGQRLIHDVDDTVGDGWDARYEALDYGEADPGFYYDDEYLGDEDEGGGGDGDAVSDYDDGVDNQDGEWEGGGEGGGDDWEYGGAEAGHYLQSADAGPYDEDNEAAAYPSESVEHRLHYPSAVYPAVTDASRTSTRAAVADDLDAEHPREAIEIGEYDDDQGECDVLERDCLMRTAIHFNPLNRAPGPEEDGECNGCGGGESFDGEASCPVDLDERECHGTAAGSVYFGPLGGTGVGGCGRDHDGGSRSWAGSGRGGTMLDILWEDGESEVESSSEAEGAHREGSVRRRGSDMDHDCEANIIQAGGGARREGIEWANSSDGQGPAARRIADGSDHRIASGKDEEFEVKGDSSESEDPTAFGAAEGAAAADMCATQAKHESEMG